MTHTNRPKTEKSKASTVKTQTRNLKGLFALAIFVFCLQLFIPNKVSAATTPSLGAAGTYGVLASTFTANGGVTTIIGDAGFTTLAGSGTHTVTGADITPAATQAGTDQATALASLASQACTFTFAAGAIDLASDTTHGTVGVYTPGVYCSIGAMSIGGSGTITLSGSGTFIFRAVGALDSSADSVVALSGGASACNVFWTPTAATTLGANSTFKGTDIDPAGITVGSGTSWTGRALAFGGTVTTDTVTITKPSCGEDIVPPVCPSGNAAVTDSNLSITGSTATGTFSLAEGCKNIRISLASYEAPSATFGLPQTLFDSSTGLFNAGGPFTLTAKVPPCYYQVDLVVGDVIEHLTPNHLYGDRKLKFANGGSNSCQPPPPVCPTDNNSILNHSTKITGNQITGKFSIAEGCEKIEVSLATYQALTPTFTLPQTLFDSATGFFNAGGPYTLTAMLPPCYFQWDLVRGPVIEHLTSDNLYGDRKLEFGNGGSNSCQPPPVCPSGNAAVTDSNLSITGSTATGTFSLAEGCKNIRISLASYEAPSATFGLPQTLFDSSTGLFNAGGPFTLTAKVPPCYYQVDLVVGDVIEHLTPDHLYGDRKLKFANGGSNSCQPPPPVVTIAAYKVVCLSEADLPNWGTATASGKPSMITATTAAAFVAASNGKCHLTADWSFQYGFAQKDGTAGVHKLIGTHIGPADGTSSTGMCDPTYCGTNTFTGSGYANWKNFDSSTSSGGVVAAKVQISNLQGASGIWVRENLKSGYVPFSYPPSAPGSDVSAELYCHTDIMNYDNYDEIINPALNKTYYCVAFNALKPQDQGGGGGGGGGSITSPTLKVTKVVVNNNEGRAVVADFPLKVNNTVVVSGVANTFDAGTYVITETGPTGYTSTFSGDCDSTGHITLVVNHNYSCTLTNTVTLPRGGSNQVSNGGGGGGGGGSTPPPAPTPTPAPSPAPAPTPTPLPVSLNVGGTVEQPGQVLGARLPRTGTGLIFWIVLFLLLGSLPVLIVNGKKSAGDA